jgi:hypothetical protein
LAGRAEATGEPRETGWLTEIRSCNVLQLRFLQPIQSFTGLLIHMNDQTLKHKGPCGVINENDDYGSIRCICTCLSHQILMEPWKLDNWGTGVWFLTQQEIVLFSTVLRPTLVLAQRPIEWESRVIFDGRVVGACF